MLANPAPTELRAPLRPDRPIEEHRSLFCSSYDLCLDEAVKRGWNSWTCERCRRFASEPEEDLVEAHALRRLV